MKKIQIIEEIGVNGSVWVMSLTDSNPSVEDSFEVSDEKEAARIKTMLENWANK